MTWGPTEETGAVPSWWRAPRKRWPNAPNPIRDTSLRSFSIKIAAGKGLFPFLYLPILFLFLTSPLFSQEDPIETEVLAEESSSDGDDLSEGEIINEEISLEDLTLEELYFERDLELSTTDELRIWCRSLGLDDEGSDSEMKKFLREYYAYESVTLKEEGSGENALEISIESADSTEYYQIEDKGEEIHLTGGVQLTVNDLKEDREYVISADKIVFSRLDDSLTALGNVEYSRQEEGESAEKFLGESMTFHIEGWQGVIYDGVSSRTDSVDGEDIEFYFTGKEITSSGFDLAIMDKGAITSGKWEDPEYRIQASKIWLLGPEEWGLANGVLYLGRIPLLYLPFYYKPGNELFFNPSIGFRTREGTTIQTTTYLIGRKDPENTSFFSAGLNSDSLYELERNGLYLYKGEKTTDSNDEYLKLMVDYYSRLGGFVGLEGEIEPGESSEAMEIFWGLGVSRSIDESNSYSVYYADDGEYKDYWNSSYIGSLELPFRWGAEFSYSIGDLNIDLMYYSDPSFMDDFTSDRVENFDPLNFVLSDLGEDSTDSDSDISSFDWELSWDKTFSTERLSPYVESLKLTTFDLTMDWSSEDDENYDSDDDSIDDAVDLDDSPVAEFFYPESITFPDAAFSLSGTFWSSSDSSSESESTGNPEEWRFPDGTEGSYTYSEGEGGTYDLPEMQSKKTLSTGDNFSGSLSWSSSSTTLLVSDFDNFLEDDDETNDVTPENITFELDQGKLSLTNKEGLSLDLDFFDSILSFDHSESFTLSHRKYLSLTGEDLDLTDDELEDQYSYDSVKWTNSSDLKLSPIRWEPMESSYLQYSLGLQMYKKSFDDLDDESNPVFEEEWLMTDADTVTESEAKLYLKFNPVSNFTATSTLSTALYTDGSDETSSIDNSLSLTTGPLTSSVSHGLDRDGDEWSSDLLSYKGTLDLSPLDLSLSNTYKYDLEHSRVDSNTTTLSGYGFSASLDADYTTDYDWDKDELEWVSGDDNFQLSSAEIDYSTDWDMPPLWKNRVNATIDASTGWEQNLIKVNDSVMDFSLSLDLSIYKFIELSIGMESENENMYLYVPAYREELGIDESYNFFEDLLRSFNFFNTQDRYDSFFNLSAFTLDLEHDLGNWNFTLDYSGSPELNDDRYEWESTLSFYLEWDPVPSLNIDIDKDSDDDWDIKAGDTD